jgi:predicted DNA binding CopG/RHH family protein
MNTSNKAGKKKITYGKVELDADEFAPENCKFRVTMFIPMDVLDEIRKRAKAKSLPYQIYINQVLRDHVFGDSEKERIRAVVREELAKTG